MELTSPGCLLAKGPEVHGIVRRAAGSNTQRIDQVYQDRYEGERKLVLHYGDLSDPVALVKLLCELKSNEIYNLGAQSPNPNFDPFGHAAWASQTATDLALESEADRGSIQQWVATKTPWC